MIAENVKRIKSEIASGNAFGEAVTLVAAIKTQTAEAVNQAIEAGVDAVAENKPQEFRDKNALIAPCPRHFIGHLQTNKVKYLIGNVELIHSCDRDDLAVEIAKQSQKKGVTTGVLVQVNIGNEQSKGGYAFDETEQAVERLCAMQGIRVEGLMAMLPDSDNENLLRSLAKKMRGLFEKLQKSNAEIKYLSMGMSGDYKLCLQEGSNVIRLGSTIFGARDYSVRN